MKNDVGSAWAEACVLINAAYKKGKSLLFSRGKVVAAAWLAMLLFSFLVYAQGISGGFLLDDYQNLRLLSDIRAPLTWQKIFDFVVLQGQTNLLGRPVSLATFALQYSSWPDSPGHFKLINILLHLINATLVLVLALKIGRKFTEDSRVLAVVATWSASVWLLHPINVSTVLYVVQRMAELSSLFMLLAAVIYVDGRNRLIVNNDKTAYVLITLAVVVFGAAAIFSKENGVLTPVMLLAIELTVYANDHVDKRFSLWRLLMLWLPAFIIFVYLVYLAFEPKPALRNFNVYERLITQPRILFDYIGKIIFPRPRSFGLYFDGYPWSRGIFLPVTTLFSIVGVFFLITFSVVYRRKYRLFSFSVLWFFAGHLLESSSVMLEMYFEHRNYVPMVGLLIAFPLVLTSQIATTMGRNAIYTGLVLMLLTALSLTWGEIRLWSNSYVQAQTWADERPDSLRAQEVAAGSDAVHAGFKSGYDRYMKASHAFPDSASPISAAIFLTCGDKALPLPDIADVESRFRKNSFSFGPLSNLEQIVIAIEKGACDRFDIVYLERAMDALLANPAYSQPAFKGHLLFLKARLMAYERKLAPAIYFAELANEQLPRVDIALYQAEWLFSAGAIEDAKTKIMSAKIIADKIPLIKRRVYLEMIADLEIRRLQPGRSE